MPRPSSRWLVKIHCLFCLLATLVVLLPFAWTAGPAMHAQTSCPCPGTGTSLGRVRVKVRAKKAGDTFFWVLSSFPDSSTENDLQITDGSLHQRIKLALNEIAANGTADQFGFTDAADFNLIATLNEQFASAGTTFFAAPELNVAPALETETRESFLCVCGRAGATPTPMPVTPGQYRVFVVLKTASATENQTPMPPLIQAEATVENLPVKLFYTRQDLKNAATDPQARANPKARVEAELRAVAQRLITLARVNRLLDAAGKLIPTPTDDPNAVKVEELTTDRRTAFVAARDALIPAFKQSYELTTVPPTSQLKSAVQWRGLSILIGPCLPEACTGGPAEPCNQLCGQPPLPTFVISVTGLQIVRHVALKVQPDELDRKFADQKVGQEFNELRRTIAKKLNLEYKNKFAVQPGHVATWEQIEQDHQLLCPAGNSNATPQCKAIANFLQLSSPPKRRPPSKPLQNLAANLANEPEPDDFNDDSALIYEVERRRKTPGALGINAGAQYSPAESFLGTVGVKEYNLLGLGKLDLGERASLDFARGAQVQKIRFQLSRPFVTPERAGLRIKDVSIAVNYMRDRNQRLSNLTPEEIEARELGSSAAITFGYDSFKPEDYLLLNCDTFKTRKRTHITLNGETSLGFRDLDIPESQKLLTLTGLSTTLLPQPNTQITPLALNLSFGLTHDARQLERAGLGHINFALDTKLQHGLDWFGADYSYDKNALTARAEIVFGALSPEDFFLRYSHGIGQSSERTPVTELFRLGGLSNVRGIEEGEFIGRRLSFGQAEFGINALALWHLLHRTAAPELNQTPCATNAGTEGARSPLPFDPANLYFKTFYDFARISDPTSFTGPGPLPRRLNQFANGYGIALELRQLGNDVTAPLSFSFGYARSPQSFLHRQGTLFTGVSYSF
jgi:hypothetical protein